MTRVIHLERTTTASRDEVWRLLGDSARWVDWTPLDESRVETPEADGRHEIRWVRNGRHRIREEVVERVPRQRFAYTVRSGLAVRDYLATVTLADAPGDATGTLIVWHTGFAARVPGTGWLYATALRRATTRFVDGLARAAAAS